MISFNALWAGFIVGVIDAYGAVHSEFVELGEKDPFHSDLFPSNFFKRWRWSYDKGLTESVLSSSFDVEDWDKVQRHVIKKYRIKFWDNGHHDINFFMEMMEKEDCENVKF